MITGIINPNDQIIYSSVQHLNNTLFKIYFSKPMRKKYCNFKKFRLFNRYLLFCMKSKKLHFERQKVESKEDNIAVKY